MTRATPQRIPFIGSEQKQNLNVHVSIAVTKSQKVETNCWASVYTSAVATRSFPARMRPMESSQQESNPCLCSVCDSYCMHLDVYAMY